LADAGRTDQALVLATSLADTHPDNVEVQLGAAYVRLARGEHLDSIQYLDRVLRLDPRHKDAFRLRILTIAELGAPFLATAEAKKWPEALEVDDRYRLEGDRLARRINWSELPPEAENERFEEADRALSGLEPFLRRAGLNAPGPFLRARFDRLLALRSRVEMEAIIAAWKRFVEEEKEKEEEDRVDIPFYVHRAVGDAYLYLEKTDEAVEQYRQALLESPEDFNARFSLFYALIEDEDFAEAFEVIDRLEAEQPIWRSRSGLKEPQPNPRRLAAELTAALGRAFADQLEEGQRRLEMMSDEAPLNTDIRSELAMVYRWRGWPTKALAEYELALRIEPELLGARIGRAQTHIDLGQFEAAEKRVYELVEHFPEHKHVRRLEKDWKRENIWRLVAEGGAGRSTGEQLGTRDRLFDTFFYSPRLAHRFRPYAHFLFSDAVFSEGTSRYARFGMGVDHSAHRTRLFGEVHASVEDETDPGVTLGVNWNPDDRWGLGGRYESFSTEVPLRAYLRDIQGHLFRMNLAYRSSDLTRFDGSVSRLDMTDGNERLMGGASAERRLATVPQYKLTALFDFFTSANSLGDRTVYFNPERDASLGATFINDLGHFRRSERFLTHRVIGHLGDYWQKGYGHFLIGTVRYEMDWGVTWNYGLRVGVGWATRVYDGDREQRVWLYFTSDWRFGK
jgi:biofilm PGA synthesis protein PgaA